MPLRFANGIFSFANGNVEYLLGKLDGIARTLCQGTEYRTGCAMNPREQKSQTDTITNPLVFTGAFSPQLWLAHSTTPQILLLA